MPEIDIQSPFKLVLINSTCRERSVLDYALCIILCFFDGQQHQVNLLSIQGCVCSLFKYCALFMVTSVLCNYLITIFMIMFFIFYAILTCKNVQIFVNVFKCIC